MNKKILLNINSLGGGGAEKVAVEIANNLISNNFNVHICYFVDRKNKEYSLNKAVNRHFKACNNLFSKAYFLNTIIKKHKIHEVISFTDGPNIASFIASYINSTNVKFIPTIHNDLRERDKHVHKSLKFYLVRFLHRLVCKFSEKIVCVSVGAKNSLSEYYGVSKDKIVVVYNPIIKLVPDLTRRPVSRKLKIIAAGRLTEQKNFSMLINASEILMKNGVDFNVDIFGDGELHSELKTQIESKDLNHIVKLKGFVSDLSKEMQSYDVFVLTSKWEGFGNVLVEALIEGLTIISTDCPSGPREVLKNGQFGYLIPKDSSFALAEKIQDKNLFSQLNYSGEELSKHLSQFTEKSVISRYIDLLK